MSLILSDFYLSCHLCFCWALRIDFVICNVKKLILKAYFSDRIYLIPLLSTGKEHWPWCQLLRVRTQPVYTRSPCSPVEHQTLFILVSFILPGRRRWGWPFVLLYFLWLCRKKQVEWGNLVMFGILLTFLRSSELILTTQSHPLNSCASCLWNNLDVISQPESFSWSFKEFFFFPSMSTWAHSCKYHENKYWKVINQYLLENNVGNRGWCNISVF